MPDLVSDDVGLRKITGGAELPPELVEETEIEIDLAVAGTVERASRRFADTACRLDGVPEQHDARGLVTAAEQLVPGLLRVGRDRVHEVDHLFFLGRGRRGSGRPGVLDRNRSLEQGEKVGAGGPAQE